MRKKPPPVVVDSSSKRDELYVRVPVSAAMVSAVREHVTNAAAIKHAVDNLASLTAEEVIGLFTSSANAVLRDAAVVKKALRRRL